MQKKREVLIKPGFEEFPATFDDFQSTMAGLSQFLRISDQRFEDTSRPKLITSVYHRPKIIQHEQKIADKSFYVKQGMAFAFYYDCNNEIVPFRLFVAGEIAQIPESLHTGKPATYSLMACKNTRLVEMGHQNLQEIYTLFPEAVFLSLHITASLCEKDRMKDQMQGLDNKESILKFYKTYPFLYRNNVLWFRDKYIAAYLHISTITFSKLKRKIYAGNRKVPSVVF